MCIILRQALMLGTALLLALPPGWCCKLLPQAGNTLPAPASRCACCADHSAPLSHTCPTLQQDAPSPERAFVCCCPADNALREGSDTTRADLSSLSLPPVTCAGMTLVAALIARSQIPFPASAPLQLLHCVWLC
jgi:hypothetical protein